MWNHIYYFSGTGNSMRAAVKIAQRLGQTQIISMRCDPAEVSAGDCDVVGFVFPVYHWTMPEAAARFVEALEVNPNAYIFAVAMPSFVVGESCERLQRILQGKGAKVSYGAKVNSVANYVIVYPPVPPAKLTLPRTEKKLDAIAEEIAQRCVRDIPRENAFIRHRRKRVMTPYKQLQQYADEPFTISSDCVSCGLCAKVCPVRNIVLENGKPTFQHHCAQCMACVAYCPKRAIGYDIRGTALVQNKELLKKAPIVKLMGLPEKRNRYHNPHIKASDLMRNTTDFE